MVGLIGRCIYNKKLTIKSKSNLVILPFFLSLFLSYYDEWMNESWRLYTNKM
jgi:hypothetical protein